MIENSVDFLQFCKSLANEKRQFIVFEVFGDKQEHTVGDIAKQADIAISTTSEHLSILKRAGVLASRKVEREVLYKLDPKAITLVVNHLNDWLECC